MERRRFLQVAGVAGASAMTTLSGCSSLPGGGGGGGTPSGDRATYDSWVAAGVSEPLNAFTLDLEVYRTLQNQEEGTQTQTETSSNVGSDPLAGIPATYLFAAALGLGFGLARTGLSSLIQQDGSARRAHFVDNGIVLEGSLDADSVGSSVSGAGAQEVESYAGYTIYRSGSGSDATVISVSGDAAVVVRGGENVADPMARIRRLLDANAGNTDRYRGASDDYDSLVTALPSRGIMGVTYSSDGGLFEVGGAGGGGGTSGLASFSDLDLSGNAVGGATSASLTTERLESSLAILYESESEVDAKADIEAALGGQAGSSSVTIDGRMVYVEGTYEDPSTSDS